MAAVVKAAQCRERGNFGEHIVDGIGVRPKLNFAQARLQSDFTTRTGLTRFLPAKLGGDPEAPEVELLRWQGSGDLMAASRANCYIVVPPGRERFAAGESISILLP